MFDFLTPKFTPNASGMKLRSWRPELTDHRDKKYTAPPVTVREFVNPLGATYRIHNQGALSSCTGHAGTAMVEIALGLRGTTNQLSRLFCYYLAREMIGEAALDMGAYNRDVIKSIVKLGVPKETFWRYSANKVTTKPSQSAYKHAEDFRLLSESQRLIYEKVEGLNDLLAAINAGQPVMFGFLAFDHLYALNDVHYTYTMPVAANKPIGGHAVVADGYDKADQTVWVQNSWGAEWGKNGYFKMPFEWFYSGPGLTDDLWTVRRGLLATPARTVEVAPEFVVPTYPYALQP